MSATDRKADLMVVFQDDGTSALLLILLVTVLMDDHMIMETKKINKNLLSYISILTYLREKLVPGDSLLARRASSIATRQTNSGSTSTLTSQHTHRHARSLCTHLHTSDSDNPFAEQSNMASTPLPVDRTPPTTAAFVIATAILAGLAGYFIGQGASIGVFGPSPAQSGSRKGKKKQEDVKTLLRKEKRDAKVKIEEGEEEKGEDYSDGDEFLDSDSEDEDEEEKGGELATFEGNKEEVKLVLVVRTDLGMSKGEYFSDIPSSRDFRSARLHFTYTRNNAR